MTDQTTTSPSDIARIERICDKLKTLWLAVPYMSLGEIVDDAGEEAGVDAMIYLGDEEFEEWLDGQPVFHPEGTGAPV